MDLNKFAMLKATLKGRQTISVVRIKADFNVDDEEAQEMLNKLIQAGAVDSFPLDGVNFRVR